MSKMPMQGERGFLEEKVGCRQLTIVKGRGPESSNANGNNCLAPGNKSAGDGPSILQVSWPARVALGWGNDVVFIYGLLAVVAAGIHVVILWSHGLLLAIATAPLAASAIALAGAVYVAVPSERRHVSLEG